MNCPKIVFTRIALFLPKCTKCRLAARLRSDTLRELKRSTRPLSSGRGRGGNKGRVGVTEEGDKGGRAGAKERKEGKLELRTHRNFQKSAHNHRRNPNLVGLPELSGKREGSRPMSRFTVSFRLHPARRRFRSPPSPVVVILSAVHCWRS